MLRRTRRGGPWWPVGRAVVAALALVAGACTGGGRTPNPPPPAAASRPVVVASFNFPESELLGEIYAQALEASGVPVRRELGLGTREMVLPAERQGLVDVVPEYLGSALAAVDPEVAAGPAPSEEGERSRLAGIVGHWGFQVLDPAPAQNQNGLAVTLATSRRYHLDTVSSLAPVAPRLRLGGPSECPGRPYCLVGLRSLYGLHFASFVPFDAESQRVTALEEQVVDVAVVFTTDGELATGHFVLLGDDRHLQPAENVIPLVSRRAVARYGARVASSLDAVSSRLTTASLTFLNWRIGPGGRPVAEEARAWLQRQGLVPRHQP